MLSKQELEAKLDFLFNSMECGDVDVELSEEDSKVVERYPVPKLYVPNTVAQCRVNETLDLMTIAVIANARYEPTLFPAIVIKIKVVDQEYCTIVSFTTGHLVIIGASTEFLARMATIQFCFLINSMFAHMNVRVSRWTIPNRVVCHSFPFKIDLDRLYADYKFCSLYDSSTFAGLKMSRLDVGCTAIVFSNCVNFTGVRHKGILPELQQSIHFFALYRL